jgi:hypothetical protein
MTTIRAGHMTLPEGSRLIILDFYDGVSEGILGLGSAGQVYHIKMSNNSDWEPRTFDVYQLPDSAIDDSVRILGESQTPKWPAWYPIWEFNDEKTQRAVEAVFDQIVSQGKRTDWEFTSSDISDLESVTLAKKSAAPSPTVASRG